MVVSFISFSDFCPGLFLICSFWTFLSCIHWFLVVFLFWFEFQAFTPYICKGVLRLKWSIKNSFVSNWKSVNNNRKTAFSTGCTSPCTGPKTGFPGSIRRQCEGDRPLAADSLGRCVTRYLQNPECTSRWYKNTFPHGGLGQSGIITPGGAPLLYCTIHAGPNTGPRLLYMLSIHYERIKWQRNSLIPTT